MKHTFDPWDLANNVCLFGVSNWYLLVAMCGVEPGVWLEAPAVHTHRRFPAAFRRQYDSYGCRQNCDMAHLYVTLRLFQTQREWSDSNPGSGDRQPGAAVRLSFLCFVQTFDSGFKKFPFLPTYPFIITPLQKLSKAWVRFTGRLETWKKLGVLTVRYEAWGPKKNHVH